MLQLLPPIPISAVRTFERPPDMVSAVRSRCSVPTGTDSNSKLQAGLKICAKILKLVLLFQDG